MPPESCTPHPRRRAPRVRSVLAATLTALAVGTGVLSAPAGAAAPAAGVGRGLDGRTLQAALERVVTGGGGIGAVADVRAGHRRWSGAAGASRLDPAHPARPWMQLRAGSVTKPAIAVLALQMVARGRWTLDTTIGDVLPGLWPARAEVTLRQLLSHTSGMPEMLAPLLAEAVTEEEFLAVLARRRTDRELVDAARSQAWLFEPGTGWTYSNTNYVVVGMMLRRATGDTVADLLRTRVLAPAHMTRSRFARGPHVRGPWLREHAVVEGRPIGLDAFDPTMFSSAGALLTTAGDLNRFHRALVARRLLPGRLVRLMRTPAYADPATGIEYGLGTFRLPDPCAPGRYLHGHDGATFGTLTLSFSSADGRRRVTVASTGRHLDDPARPGVALGELLLTAFEETCAPGAPAAVARGGASRVPAPGQLAVPPFAAPRS